MEHGFLWEHNMWFKVVSGVYMHIQLYFITLKKMILSCEQASYFLVTNADHSSTVMSTAADI